MAAETKPGIYYDMPRDEYDAIDAANWSRIKHIIRSPAHYQAELLTKRDTPAMAFGRVAHEVILENKRNFVSGGPINPKTNKPFGPETKAFSEWAATQTVPVLSTEDAERLDNMKRVLELHSTATTILDGTAREVSIVWVHEATGLLCKARIDLARVSDIPEEDSYLGDYKTTEDASYKEFFWTVRRSLYNAQMAMYADGLMEATGRPPMVFVIAQEKSAPWAVACYSLGPTVMNHGREAYTRALTSYAECMKTGQWPAYPDQVQLLEID